MSQESCNSTVYSDSAGDNEFIILIEELSNEDAKNFLPEAKKGHTIDEFEVLNFIGEGSYAKVMKVRHKKTENICALKIVSKKRIKKV